MYALLINPTSQLPTVVNCNSSFYPELMDAGYEQLMTGRKNALLDKEKELIEELYPQGYENEILTD